jgi:hypothetical protein
MRNALDSSHHEGDALSLPKRHQGHEGDKKSPFVYFVSFVLNILSPENIWAIVLFLVAVALIVLTTDDSPNWIYQGF